MKPKDRKLEAVAQSSLTQFLSPSNPWKIDDPKSKKIHQKIMNFMAIDNQLFSICEDQGFIELIAHLQPKYIIPSRRFFFR